MIFLFKIFFEKGGLFDILSGFKKRTPLQIVLKKLYLVNGDRMSSNLSDNN
jgi:hypothetical protein